MFGKFISNTISKRVINACIKNNLREVSVFNGTKIQSAVVFIQSSQYEKKEDYINLILRATGMQPHNMCVCVLRTQNKELENFRSNKNEFFLNRKELNWLFFPKNKEEVFSAIKGKDLYLNLCDDNYVPIEYLIANCDTGLKIGINQKHYQKNYHILLNVKQTLEHELKWLIQKIA